MSQQVIYPAAPQQQQPAVLHGETQPDQLSPVHQSAIGHHSSVMQGQNSYMVAQLPVTPAESHQQSGMFPRSVSMPLPSSNCAAVQSGDDPSTPGGSKQQPLLGSNGNEVKSATVAKIQDIKNWSISTYKCTKQLISEKLGKSSRTVDTELESQIELLREVQHKYLNILRLSRALSSHFQHVVITQVIYHLWLIYLTAALDLNIFLSQIISARTRGGVCWAGPKISRAAERIPLQCRNTAESQPSRGSSDGSPQFFRLICQYPCQQDDGRYPSYRQAIRSSPVW